MYYYINNGGDFVNVFKNFNYDINKFFQKEEK